MRSNMATKRPSQSLVSLTNCVSLMRHLWNENNTDMHSRSSDRYGFKCGGSASSVRETGAFCCS